MTPEQQTERGMPDMIQHYHSVYPLEDAAKQDNPSTAFNIPTHLIKGISLNDGQAYTLRHLEPRQVCTHMDVKGFF